MKIKHADIKMPHPPDVEELLVSHGDAAIPSNIEIVTAIPETPIASIAWVYKIERYIKIAIRISLFALSMALGALMAGQVFLRYVLQSPFLGMEEMAPMIALWIYFLGMAHATRERVHINGGIIGFIFNSPIVIHFIRMVGTLLCAITSSVFAYYSVVGALKNLSFGRTSVYMGLSKGFWDFSIVVGLYLVTFYFLLQLIAEMRLYLELRKNRAVQP